MVFQTRLLPVAQELISPRAGDLSNALCLVTESEELQVVGSLRSGLESAVNLEMDCNRKILADLDSGSRL